jgi:hypothetical protein
MHRRGGSGSLVFGLLIVVAPLLWPWRWLLEFSDSVDEAWDVDDPFLSDPGD